jgi:AcrR family transcriptional regulator
MLRSETSREAAHSAPAAGSRGDLRREAILRAATALFLEKGYGGTSIGAVNRRAGGSRTSIYQYFGSKEALFGAIVAQKCGEIFTVLAEPDIAARPPREALTRFGYRFLEIVLAPEGIALTRAVIADSGRFPELARVFHEAGPVAGKARLADYLAEQAARGTLVIADPATASRQLADMMIGTLQMRALLGVAPPSEAECRRVVDEAVETFLRATAPKPPGSGD